MVLKLVVFNGLFYPVVIYVYLCVFAHRCCACVITTWKRYLGFGRGLNVIETNGIGWECFKNKTKEVEDVLLKGMLDFYLLSCGDEMSGFAPIHDSTWFCAASSQGL